MTTVKLFTVTSRVCPVVRSMFFNLTYLDLLFLLRESLLEDFEPCGLLEPGSWCCCALTSAEFSRGFLVDVPKTTEKGSTVSTDIRGPLDRRQIASCWHLSFGLRSPPSTDMNRSEILISSHRKKRLAHQHSERNFPTVCSCWTVSSSKVFGVFQADLSSGIF
jgi:hypothetical protein